MDDKITIYADCADCTLNEHFCHRIGELRWHDGRLLCYDCFDDGPYREYDEGQDEFLPDWDGLPRLTWEQCKP